MMLHRAFLLAFMVGLSSPVQIEELAVRIKSDLSLIVPGFGAEGVVLGEPVASLLRDRGRPDRVAVPGKAQGLFKEVFAYAEGPSVRFDRIFHYAYGRFAVFLLADRVVAVASYERGRVSIDAVNLSSGVESFVFNYGNSGLVRHVSEKGTMYIYPGLGIAVADDGNDDSIDLLLIFSPLSSGQPGSSNR